MPLPEQEPIFTVYDDIRQKLIAQGMPADQIAFIHEANTEVRKKELFSKVWCCTIKVDIENSKGQYIEKDKQEATKDGSESTKIQHGI